MFNKFLEILYTIVGLAYNVNFWRVLILFGIFVILGTLFFTSGLANFLIDKTGNYLEHVWEAYRPSWGQIRANFNSLIINLKHFYE